MNLNILTTEDLKIFKLELIEEIRKILQVKPPPELLKSADVRRMLKCSPGTLQNLRIKGELPFTKVGGTIYYYYADVIKIGQKNKSASL